MKKNNYYVETSDSEVDLNNRLRYAIILMVWRSVFTVKMKKKTRKLKMAIETVRKKKKTKIRAHQQEIRSQRVAAREAADSLDFPALDLDETEFEEQDSNSDEAEIVDPTTERCIKTHFFSCLL